MSRCYASPDKVAQRRGGGGDPTHFPNLKKLWQGAGVLAYHQRHMTEKKGK